MRIHAFQILLFLLIAWMPPAIAASDDTVPEHQRKAIAVAETIGRLVYLHDKAAWLSTDALLAASAFQSPPGKMKGWVTGQVEEGRIGIAYLADVNGEIVAFARADTWPGTERVADARGLQPTEPLTPAEHRLYTAIQLAQSADGVLNCSSHPLNVVAFEDPQRKDTTLVFLMSPWSNEGAPLGGFEMLRIDADGNTILERFAQTRGCLVMTNADLAQASALTLTHVTSPAPTAFHVFLSLQYGKPVYVSTSEGMWVVQNGFIAYKGGMENK